MSKYLDTVFISADKDEAEEQMHIAAATMDAMGKGATHGAKVVEKAGVFQVEIYEKDKK